VTLAALCTALAGPHGAVQAQTTRVDAAGTANRLVCLDVPTSRREAAWAIVKEFGAAASHVEPYTLTLTDPGADTPEVILDSLVPSAAIAVAIARTLLAWHAKPSVIRLPSPFTAATIPGVLAATGISFRAADAVHDQLAAGARALLTTGAYGSTLRPGSQTEETLTALLSDLMPRFDYPRAAVDRAQPPVGRCLGLVATAAALAAPSPVLVTPKGPARSSDGSRSR
jgi:hypothetical protein